MKLRQKLTLGLVFLSLFVIISGVFGIIYTELINNKLSTITKVTSPLVETIDDMIIILWKSHNIINEYHSEKNITMLDDLRLEFDNLLEDFDRSESNIRKLITEENIIVNLNNAIIKKNDFKDNAVELMIAYRNSLKSESKEEKEKYNSVINDLSPKIEKDLRESAKILDEIALRISTFSKNAEIESQKAVRNTIAILSIITLLSIVFAIFIGIFLSKSIIKPVDELAKAASEVSHGNFNVNLKISSPDEIGHLSSTFNQMTYSLKKMLEESPKLRKYLTTAQKPKSILDIEEKNSYLIKSDTPKKAYEMFLEKTSSGFSGLCITRTNPDIIREKYGIEYHNIIFLSDIKEKKFLSTSNLDQLYKIINDFINQNPKSIILIDRIDYLIARHSFANVLRFITRLNDKIITSLSVLLIPVDSMLIIPQNLSYLEKELTSISLPKESEIPYELQKILTFIINKNIAGKPPTFKDISKEFSITAPTTQKKIQDLESLDLIRVVKQGRNKLLEPTAKSREFLA